MPRPRSAKKLVKLLTCARSSTCGPTSTPSTSSTTTTGMNSLRAATAASVPARAAAATMTRNESVSTRRFDVSTASTGSAPVMSGSVYGGCSRRRGYIFAAAASIASRMRG